MLKGGIGQPAQRVHTFEPGPHPTPINSTVTRTWTCSPAMTASMLGPRPYTTARYCAGQQRESYNIIKSPYIDPESHAKDNAWSA